MAAKTESAPAASATPDAQAPKAGGFGSMVPALIAIILAPASCWAVAQYVLIPQLKASLSDPAVLEAAAEAHAAAPEHGAEASSGGHGGGGHGSKEGAAGPTFKFQDVVVNLSGTMGTRYLKTTFVVTGSNPKLAAEFEANRAQLTDVTLGVLSSLTLIELEEPGAKNLIREKLVTAYNQALGRKVAEQVYFSDFVIQ